MLKRDHPAEQTDGRHPNGPRLSKGRFAVIVVVAVLTLSVGSYVALANSGAPSTPSQAAASTTPGPKRLIRAYELTGAKPASAFALNNGDLVTVLAGDGARCLMRTWHGKAAGESCASDAGLASGSDQGIVVTDDCGASEDNRMEIIGLAPEGTTSVRLEESNGTSHTTDVVEGAFRFEGTNPGPEEPYPTGVSWLQGSTGAGSAELPVAGDQFCEPAE